MAFKPFDTTFDSRNFLVNFTAFSCSTFLGRELLADEIHPLPPTPESTHSCFRGCFSFFFNILLRFNNQFGVNS